MNTEAVIPDGIGELEAASAEEVLRWALERYHPRVAFASSFGAEDVVVLDMLARLRPDARVFTLDTGRLPEQTYEVIEALRTRYGLKIEVFFPQAAAIEKLERDKGLFSFRDNIENRKECCGIRKIEPLNRAMDGLEAWVTGLRREQAITRGLLSKVEPDPARPGVVKINPLADWTETQVWDRIRERSIPYNALHDQGFPSIGCAPCTRAILPGEDIRAGRWWWERPEHKECGLHAARFAEPPTS
jgi:phosphoadenosine phosphosulfate reductase